MTNNDITRLLAEVRGGNDAAEIQLVELTYPHLRRIARRYLRGEKADHTLQPTALVNEAYLELIGQMNKNWQDRAHFYAVAAKVMRRILVTYARRKKATKRDGRLHRIELTDDISVAENRLDEILTVDEALKRLAAFDARRSRVVELRFFGGLTENEIADVLQIAPRTVKRDWNVARAWLRAELRARESTT